MNELIYTGVGSRKTPSPMLTLMEALAGDLRDRGYTCRSGHADGADMAFEKGARGRIELYLPWGPVGRFNGPPLYKPDVLRLQPALQARMFASLVHPAWDKLNRGAQLLHSRNVHQLLGSELVDVNGEPLTPLGVPATPSEFLVCWTERGKVTGGTATAIRLAQMFKIPIYNLYFDHDRARFEVEQNLRCAA